MLKNQVFLCPLFLFLSHTFQTHMCEKDLNHVFKNNFKNTSIALPKSYTLYTIQSEIYVGIYAFFMLGKNLAGEYVTI